MFEEIFLRKKPVSEKLEQYGFETINSVKTYRTDILNGEFHLEVAIGRGAMPDTRLVEAATNEEYILYKTDAVGGFVGTVRSSVAKILQDISSRCYETASYKGEQTERLIGYIREKYGDEMEYLWEKFPDNAVWRRRDSFHRVDASYLLAK